jgi:hypothetical protein
MRSHTHRVEPGSSRELDHLAGAAKAFLAVRLVVAVARRAWDLAISIALHAKLFDSGPQQFCSRKARRAGRGVDLDLDLVEAVRIPPLPVRRVAQ